ncbi:MAG TPA: PfkB family carbohydrate kinase [Candidatus Thermoplasmatota archaeon]|nr:PfkB family carbohydrate kinase [Candidatus Thermoplasmatota archaeon]
MTLAVAGHSNLDVQLQVQELPKPGMSVPVLERRTVWGGTAGNIARHAGGLGVPVRLWSRVGPDFPPAWRSAFEQDGVDLTFLDVAKDQMTPTCFILTDLLDRQSYAMDQGAMGRIDEHPVGPELLNGLDEDSWLHVTTGNPLGYAHVVDAARKSGIRVAFDPGQELRFQYDTRSFEGLLDQSEVLFVNEPELRVACDYLRYGSAEQLLDHVQAVVVTRAEKGATLYRPKAKPLSLPAFPVKVVDPTGAGDALRAGWYAALNAGHDMGSALRWGLAAAAVKIQHAGGQDHVVRRSEIDPLLVSAAP